MKTIRELKQQRAALLDQAQAVIDGADQAKRDLSTEERGQIDSFMQQASAMQADIQQREQLEGMRGELRSASTQPSMNATIGMSEREIEQYSISRAIRAQAEYMLGNHRALDEAGLEMEASRAVAKKLGREPRSFFIPYDFQLRAAVLDQRALEKGGTASGAQMIATEKLTDSFIDLLRNRMMARAAGATVLGGLVGDISIPKATGGATFYMVAEGTDLTGSNQTVGQVALTPKSGGAWTEYTRKLLKQSSIDVEMFVRNDLSQVVALGIDYMALHGSGAANQPTGLASTAGIGAVVGGVNGLAPAWQHIIQLETEVATDNADVGKLAYMTNAKVRGKLKTSSKVASTDSSMLWDDRAGNTPLNGYPVHVTNQVASNLTKGTSAGVCSAIFFGNWSELIIAMWGTLDMLVDPFSNSKNGTVRVVAFQDFDIGVRHPESFSAMLDALTA